MPTDEEFEREIGVPGLVTRYRERLRESERQVETRFKQEVAALSELKRTAVQTERNHRNLLNCAVFPFTGTEPGSVELGYDYVRGSPLEELGLPNFDFLIVKIPAGGRPITAVAGEAKSSLANARRVVDEVVRKHDVLVNNLPHVLVNYLRQPTTREVRLEPVIMVDAVDSTRLVREVVDAGQSIRVWHAPLAGPPMLNLAHVPASTPDVRRFLHGDANLNNLLRGVRTNRRAFDYWPSSHPLLQLETLIAAARPNRDDPRSMLVTPDAVQLALERDLFFLNPVERLAHVQRIVEHGERIGFLGAGTSAGQFRTVAKGTGAEVLERSLEEKWIKAQLEKDKVAAVADERDRVQAEIRQDRTKVKTLADY